MKKHQVVFGSLYWLFCFHGGDEMSHPSVKSELFSSYTHANTQNSL